MTSLHKKARSHFFGKFILFSSKIFFSVFCIFHLVNKFGSELKSFQLSYGHLQWFYLFLALITFALSQIISVVRWQICCKSLNIIEGSSKFDFTLFKLYLIGLFCNNFLPSSVGGDLVRAYLLKKHYPEAYWIDCAGSVFVDRAFGVTTLSWIGFVSAFIIYQINHRLPQGIVFSMGILAIACSIIIFLGLYLKNFWIAKYSQKQPKGFMEKLKFKFNEFAEALHKIKKQKLAILNLLITSFSIQLLVTFCLMALVAGLDFQIKTLFIWIVNPLATLGSLFAPSMSGLGVREGIYAYLFKALGYSGANGILLSFSWLAIVLLVSLPGAFYMIIDKQKINKLPVKEPLPVKELKTPALKA